MGKSLFQLARDAGWLNLVYKDAETGEDVYAFYHFTFQEYFAALEVKDWHYFLNHVPDNPEQGTYRIFEPQWKEVFLLWLGREDVQKQQKETLIKALTEFQDSCGRDNFYGYRTNFLAAQGITEFDNCSFADAIITKIVKWSFGYPDGGKETWISFDDCIARRARRLLLQTNRLKAINLISDFLGICYHYTTYREAAEILGYLQPGNLDAISILIEFIRLDAKRLNELEEDGIPWYNDPYLDNFASSLRRIASGNINAINALTKLLQRSLSKISRFYIARVLLFLEPSNQTAIHTLSEAMRTEQSEEFYCFIAESLGLVNAKDVALFNGSRSDVADNPLNLPYTKQEKLKAATVSTLKGNLTDQIETAEDFEYYSYCYQTLWDCAQNLPYLEFYQAWHQTTI